MKDDNQIWSFVLSAARQEIACSWHLMEGRRQTLWDREIPRTEEEHPYPLIEGE